MYIMVYLGVNLSTLHNYIKEILISSVYKMKAGNQPIIKYIIDTLHPTTIPSRRVRSAPSICVIQLFTFPVVLIPFIRHRKHRIQENRRPRASSYLGSPTSSIPLLRLRNSLLRGKFKIKIYSSMRV